jgi:Gpi18-like mannosyltransferase
MGVGAVIALLGISYALTKEIRASAAFSLALAFNGTLAFLIPNVLVGMCDQAHMRCRLVTLPALNILSAVTAIAAVANAVWLFRKSRRDGSADEAAQAERA